MAKKILYREQALRRAREARMHANNLRKVGLLPELEKVLKEEAEELKRMAETMPENPKKKQMSLF